MGLFDALFLGQLLQHVVNWGWIAGNTGRYRPGDSGGEVKHKGS